MKTLLLMRHAKSSWDNSELADFDRPLNGRGRQDAPRIGQLLAHEDLTPDLIITSAARRAATTAELVDLAAGYVVSASATDFDAHVALLLQQPGGGLAPAQSLASYEFAGELSLSGELRPVRGALACW